MGAVLKRVYIDIDEDLHLQAKQVAKDQGKSFKSFCEEAIFNAMPTKRGTKRGSKKGKG